jgi:MFS family permease
LFLDASTLQVGALTAAASVPALVIGLPAGAWIDRHARRPVLVAMDLISAAALVTVPLAAVFGVVTIAQLYATVLIVGAASVTYDIAYQSYMPSIVERGRLAAGNGQMQASQSAARAVGPGIGGAAVQVLTAPGAVALDAVTYLCSAAWVARIRAREPQIESPAEHRPLRRDVAEGIKLIMGDRVLRAIAAYTMFSTMCIAVEHAIELLFLVRVVGLAPFAVGIVTGLASVGAVLGGLAARRLIDTLGSIRTMLVAAPVGSVFMLLLPLAGHGWRATLFAVGAGGASFGIVVFNVACLTFRQTAYPAAILGRMSATMRFISTLLFPLGALAGGAIGTAIGLRAALWGAAVVGVLATLLLAPARSRSSATDQLVPAKAG